MACAEHNNTAETGASRSFTQLPIRWSSMPGRHSIALAALAVLTFITFAAVTSSPPLVIAIADIFIFSSRASLIHAMKVTVSVCEGPPSPRANFTVTSLPTGDMILFGGECFDGQDTKCFNELFRCALRAVCWCCRCCCFVLSRSSDTLVYVIACQTTYSRRCLFLNILMLGERALSATAMNQSGSASSGARRLQPGVRVGLQKALVG